MEIILSTNPDVFDDAKEWAKKNGYGRFRIATIDLSVPPDFTKVINK
jgi:hypothetical protein